MGRGEAAEDDEVRPVADGEIGEPSLEGALLEVEVACGAGARHLDHLLTVKTVPGLVGRRVRDAGWTASSRASGVTAMDPRERRPLDG